MKRFTFAFIMKLVNTGLWLKIYLITCLRAALGNVFIKESILRFTFLSKRYYKTSVVLKSQCKIYHFNIDLKSYFQVLLCHKHGTICYVLEEKRQGFCLLNRLILVVQDIFSACTVAIDKSNSLKYLMLGGDIRDEKN